MLSTNYAYFCSNVLKIELANSLFVPILTLVLFFHPEPAAFSRLSVLAGHDGGWR